MNVSLDGQPVRFSLLSSRILLIDPLALDGLSAELGQLSQASPDKQHEMAGALGARGLRIGVVDLKDFQAGTFELGLESFESVDPSAADPTVFQLDSGTVVVIDMAALEAVARTLTWDRYDTLLQAPPNDDAPLQALIQDVGGEWFAILAGNADAALSGDGAYRLRADALRRVA